MKKLASIVAGVFMAGAALTSVSAAEHTVEKEDNLWDIATENNTTVTKLVEINELNTTTIQPKQELNLYETYKVQHGDTLIGISDAYSVSVEDLKKWNDLESEMIVIGQELEIKDADADYDKAETASANTQELEQGQAKTEQAAETESSNSKEQSSKDNPEGKTVTVEATAYTADCDGCSGVTSTGVDLNANPDAKVIAVDPSVIPIGSEVYVEGYGYATAADVGSAIQGNKIDVHVSTKAEAYDWGVRTVDVTIVNK
ncbi:LysM peptidoglycan-binding domain-containing protein [Lentibacillus lipolyticus]|nr:LysM peptidoglycan-binding domain-containing protein [Lentibacillus lipolyticus]